MVTALRASEVAGPSRNPGMPLDLDWVHDVRINRSAVERRAATLGTRRTVKKEWQAAWLVNAVRCLDLTTLAGDDTPGTVRRLCAKGIHPLRQDMVEALGIDEVHVGAICVYHNLVRIAAESLQGTGIPVAAVSTGFPAGQTPLPLKLEEIRSSGRDGADEIDIVISRAHVLTGDWKQLHDEVRAFEPKTDLALLQLNGRMRPVEPGLLTQTVLDDLTRIITLHEGKPSTPSAAARPCRRQERQRCRASPW